MNEKNDWYKKYKVCIQVSREIHRLLKDLKKDNQSFNDCLEDILIEEGYL